MKRYRNATVASSVHDASTLARYIESIAELAPDWTFPAEQSARYEKDCGVPSCCVVAASSALPRAAVHLTVQREGARALTVSNIVPLASNQLSVDEYNAVLAAFVRALRTHGRRDAVPISVILSKAESCLADVVTGVALKLLQRYLAMHPLSGHPLDIERLDQFICALSRYTRKRFDIDAFEALLIEELGWSSRDARWCRSRVEIGLEVLATNRKFCG